MGGRMKQLIASLVIVLAAGFFWKCPFKYKNSDETGYYILNCVFYPKYKDRKDCDNHARQQKCKKWKH
jgi:hypothetical protein